VGIGLFLAGVGRMLRRQWTCILGACGIHTRTMVSTSEREAEELQYKQVPSWSIR
jgi:hypothetical protein